MPRVTIGVPVYNGASALAIALQNLADQTFKDFQVLIWDNASTDETAAIAQGFATKDPRFVYQRQPRNLGSMPNFLACVSAATSPYFLWRAYDDTSSLNYVEALAGLLDAHPDAGLAVGVVKKMKRRPQVRTFPQRWPQEPLWLYRRRLVLQAQPGWIYGMFRTEEILQEITSVIAGYRHINGWDNLALLPFLAANRVVGSDQATFFQGFQRHASDPKRGRILDPDMMQQLRTDFYAYCLAQQPRLAAMGAPVSKVLLWLYADRSYRASKIVQARVRRAFGAVPVGATKKYD